MSFCTRCICCIVALWFSSVLLTVCVISLRVSVMVVFISAISSASWLLSISSHSPLSQMQFSYFFPEKFQIPFTIIAGLPADFHKRRFPHQVDAAHVKPEILPGLNVRAGYTPLTAGPQITGRGFHLRCVCDFLPPKTRIQTVPSGHIQPVSGPPLSENSPVSAQSVTVLPVRQSGTIPAPDRPAAPHAFTARTVSL